jgi:hypothetical protein
VNRRRIRDDQTIATGATDMTGTMKGHRRGNVIVIGTGTGTDTGTGEETEKEAGAVEMTNRSEGEDIGVITRMMSLRRHREDEGHQREVTVIKPSHFQGTEPAKGEAVTEAQVENNGESMGGQGRG